MRQLAGELGEPGQRHHIPSEEDRLNFDEEVRRHLRDTGEQVTLTPGLVETVRLKALKRARRRRQVLTGMTSIAAIALLTAVAANLFRWN